MTHNVEVTITAPTRYRSKLLNYQYLYLCVYELLYYCSLDLYRSLGAVEVSCVVGEGAVLATGEEDIQFVLLQVEVKFF